MGLECKWQFHSVVALFCRKKNLNQKFLTKTSSLQNLELSCQSCGSFYGLHLVICQFSPIIALVSFFHTANTYSGITVETGTPIKGVQAFLDFRGFDFRGFRFTAGYNSILFSSPLVLLSNLDLRSFCFRGFYFVSPH